MNSNQDEQAEQTEQSESSEAVSDTSDTSVTPATVESAPAVEPKKNSGGLAKNKKSKKKGGAAAEAVEAAEVVPEAPRRKKSSREDLKWYIVHTQTSFEGRAKNSLDEAIIRNHKEEEFGDILIPVESVVELVKGQRRSTERKFFPGYILVQMDLTDENWHLVRSAPRVTGFVGNARKPPSIPLKEVERITAQMVEGRTQAKPKYNFKEGDSVRVIDGPICQFQRDGRGSEAREVQAKGPGFYFWSRYSSRIGLHPGRKDLS